MEYMDKSSYRWLAIFYVYFFSVPIAVFPNLFIEAPLKYFIIFWGISTYKNV